MLSFDSSIRKSAETKTQLKILKNLTPSLTIGQKLQESATFF